MLHLAALYNNFKTLKYLVENADLLLNKKNKHGQTALDFCRAKNNIEAVKILEKGSPFSLDSYLNNLKEYHDRYIPTIEDKNLIDKFMKERAKLNKL